MKKFWNFIKNEDTSETELLFNGPISEDTWWGDEVTPALFRDELCIGIAVDQQMGHQRFTENKRCHFRIWLVVE